MLDTFIANSQIDEYVRLASFSHRMRSYVIFFLLQPPRYCAKSAGNSTTEHLLRIPPRRTGSLGPSATTIKDVTSIDIFRYLKIWGSNTNIRTI